MSIRNITRGAFGSNRKSNKKLLGLEALENRQLLATDVLVGVDGLEDISPAIGLGGTNPGDQRIVVESTETSDAFNLQWFDADGSLVNLFYQGKGVVDVQVVGETPGAPATAPTSDPGESTNINDLLWTGVASINITAYDANSSLSVYSVGQQDGVESRLDIEGAGLSNLRGITFGPGANPGNEFFGPLDLGNAWFSYGAGETGVDAPNVNFASASIGDVNATGSANGVFELGGVQGGTVSVQGGGDLLNDNGSKTIVAVNGFVPVAPGYVGELAPGFDPVNGTGQFIAGSTGAIATIDAGFTGVPGQSVWDYGANENVEFAAFRTDASDESAVFLPSSDTPGDAPSFNPIIMDGATSQAMLDEWFANTTYLGEAYVYNPAPVFEGGGTDGGVVAADPLQVDVLGNVPDGLVIGGFGSGASPESTNILSGVDFALNGNSFGADFEVGTVASVMFTGDGSQLEDVNFLSNGTVGDFKVGSAAETIDADGLHIGVSPDQGAVPSPLGMFNGAGVEVWGDASDFSFVANRTGGDVVVAGEVSGETAIEVIAPAKSAPLNLGNVTFAGGTSGLVGGTTSGAVYEVVGTKGNDSIGEINIGNLDLDKGSFLSLTGVETAPGVDLADADNFIVDLQDSSFGDSTIETLTGDLLITGIGSQAGSVTVNNPGAAGKAGLAFEDSEFGGLFAAGVDFSGNIEVILEDTKVGGGFVAGDANNLLFAAEDSTVEGVSAFGDIAKESFTDLVGSSLVNGLTVGSASDFVAVLADQSEIGGDFGATGIIEDGLVDVFGNSVVDMLKIGGVSDVLTVTADGTKTEIGSVEIGDAASVFLGAEAGAAIGDSELGKVGEFVVVSEGLNSEIGNVDAVSVDKLDVDALSQGTIGNIASGGNAEEISVLASGVGSTVESVTFVNGQEVSIEALAQGQIGLVTSTGFVEELSVLADGAKTFVEGLNLNDVDDLDVSAFNQAVVDVIDITGDVVVLDYLSVGAQTEIGETNALGDVRDAMLNVSSGGTIDDFVVEGESDNVSVIALAGGIGDLDLGQVNLDLSIGGNDLVQDGDTNVDGFVGLLEVDGVRLDLGDIALNTGTDSEVVDVRLDLDDSEIGDGKGAAISMDRLVNDFIVTGPETIARVGGGGVLPAAANSHILGTVEVDGPADTFIIGLDAQSSMGAVNVAGDLNLFDAVVGGSELGGLSVGGNVFDEVSVNAQAFGLTESKIGDIEVGLKAGEIDIDLLDTKAFGMGNVTVGGETEVVDIDMNNSLLGDLSFGKDDLSDLAVIDFSIEGAPDNFFGKEEEVGNMEFYGVVNYDALEMDSNIDLPDMDTVGNIVVDLLNPGAPFSGDLEVGDLAPNVNLDDIQAPDGKLTINDTDVGLGSLGDVLAKEDVIFSSDLILDPEANTPTSPNPSGDAGSINSVDGSVIINDNLVLGNKAELGPISAAIDVEVINDIIIGDEAKLGAISAGEDVLVGNDLLVGEMGELESIEAVQDVFIANDFLTGSESKVGPVEAGVDVIIGNDLSVGPMGEFASIKAGEDVIVGNDFVTGAESKVGPIEAGIDVVIGNDLTVGEMAELASIKAGEDVIVTKDFETGTESKVGPIEAGIDVVIGNDLLIGEMGELGSIDAGVDVIITNDFVIGDDAKVGTVSAGNDVIVGNDVVVGEGAVFSGADGVAMDAGNDVSIGNDLFIDDKATVGTVIAGNDLNVGSDILVGDEASFIGLLDTAIDAGNDVLIGEDLVLGIDSKVGDIFADQDFIVGIADDPLNPGNDIGGDIIIGEDAHLGTVEAGRDLIVLDNDKTGADGDIELLGGDAKIDALIAGDDVIIEGGVVLSSEITKIFAEDDIDIAEDVVLLGNDSMIGSIHAWDSVFFGDDILLDGDNTKIGEILAGKAGSFDVDDDIFVGGSIALSGAGASIEEINALGFVDVVGDVSVEGGGSSIGEITSGDDPLLYPDWGTLFGEVPGEGILIGGDVLVGDTATDGNSIDLIAANDSDILVIGDVLIGTGGGTGNEIGDVAVIDTFLDLNQGGFYANPTPIDIVDNAPAVPFPSFANVADRLGEIEAVRVVLDGFTHDAPSDVEVSLQAPDGTIVELMVDAGGADPVSDIDLNFVPEWLDPVPASGPLEGGNYGPGAYAAPVFVPAGPDDLNAFEGSATVNGDWQLYVGDSSVGSVGEISDGWSLQLFTSGTESGDVLFGNDLVLSGVESKLGDVVSEDGEVVINNDFASIGTKGMIGDIAGEDGVSVLGDIGLTDTTAGTISAGEYDSATGVVSPGNALADLDIFGDLILLDSSIAGLETVEGDIFIGGFLGLENSEIGEITLGIFDPDGSGDLAPVSTGGDFILSDELAMVDSKIGDITLIDGDAIFSDDVTMSGSDIGNITSGAYDQGGSNLVTGGDIVFLGKIDMLDSSIGAAGGIGSFDGDILLFDEVLMENSEIGLMVAGISDPANEVSTAGDIIWDSPVSMLDSKIEGLVANDGDIVWDDVAMKTSEIGDIFVTTEGDFVALGDVTLEDSSIGDIFVDKGDVVFDKSVTLGVSDVLDSSLTSTIGDITIGTYDDPLDIQTGGDLTFNGPVDLTNSSIAGTDGIFLEVGNVLFADTVNLTGTDQDAASSGTGLAPSVIGPIEVGRFDADDPFTSGGDVTFDGALTLENSELPSFTLIDGDLTFSKAVELGVSDTTNSDLTSMIGAIRIGETDGATTTGGNLTFADTLDLTNSTLSAADGIELVNGKASFIGAGSLTSAPLPGAPNPSVIGDITIGDPLDSTTGGDLVVTTGITGSNETSIGDLTLQDGSIFLFGPISLGDDLGAGSAFTGNTGTTIGDIDVQDGFIAGQAGVADLTAGRFGDLSVVNSVPAQGLLSEAVIRAVDFQDNTVSDGGSFGDINLVQTNESGIGLTEGIAQNPDPTKISWEYGNQILSAGSIGTVNIESDGDILAKDASLIIAAGVNSVNNGTGAGEQMRLPALSSEIPTIGDIDITADFSGDPYGDNSAYGEGFAILAGLYIEAETPFTPDSGVPLPGVPSGWYYNTVNQAQIGDITVDDITDTLDIDRGTPVTVDGGQSGLSATIAVNALSGDDIGTLTVEHSGSLFKTDLEPTVLEPFSHLTTGNPIVDDVMPSDMIVTLV